MKLNFHHRGHQFFFVTLTLDGRPAALSRLVDEASPPALTPHGEAALAVLLALHKVYPCATLSNRVIMPDHIHFLMIVNYDRAPTFNPLWVSFMLMEAIEAAWALNGRGQAPAPSFDAARLLAETVAKGRARAAAIKRSNLHQQGRGGAAHEAAPPCRAPTCASSLPPGRGGAAPVRSLAPLRFDRRAYIELSFDSRQLKAIRRYIALNPARALWKLRHPDRFRRLGPIRHAILDPSRDWSAVGNLALLGSPFLFHVRLTLKKTVAEHEAAIREIVARAARGEVPVSGFISPGEVEALRRLKATPRARFVKLLPCALPPRYDPSAEDSRELAADRLLILSGFSDTPRVSAIDQKRDPAARRRFRANCLALNDLAATLCANAQMRT